MNRRHFVFAAGLMTCASTSWAAAQEWHARLIRGKREGQTQWAGLHIMLAHGWKTYWRVPGEAGIPPQITFQGGGVSDVKVDYPLPQRIVDAGGEAIGYHDEVVFPLRLTLSADDVATDAKLSAFFGVCQDICKPARLQATWAQAEQDEALLSAWVQKVPVSGKIVTAAHGTGTELSLTLTQVIDDIFVEGPEGLYFRKPEIKGKEARLKIDGLDSGQKLAGTKLTLTASSQGKGIEQTVTVS